MVDRGKVEPVFKGQLAELILKSCEQLEVCQAMSEEKCTLSIEFFLDTGTR